LAFGDDTLQLKDVQHVLGAMVISAGDISRYPLGLMVKGNKYMLYKNMDATNSGIHDD